MPFEMVNHDHTADPEGRPPKSPFSPDDFHSYSRSPFQRVASDSSAFNSDEEDEKLMRTQKYQYAEYIYSKFFFILVAWDCLLLIRLPPALIAYCRGTVASIKFYFIFKLVTFAMYLGAAIVLFVFAMKQYRNPGDKVRLDVEYEQFTSDFKSSKGVIALTIFFLIIDAIFCYLLNVVLMQSMFRQKRLLRKQKNYAMMTRNHKGSVRIDTPPPDDQISKSNKTARSSFVNEAQSRKGRSRLSSSNKYSKADTKFRPKLDFDFNLPKNDSLDIVRKRRSSLKSHKVTSQQPLTRTTTYKKCQSKKDDNHSPRDVEFDSSSIVEDFNIKPAQYVKVIGNSSNHGSRRAHRAHNSNI